VTGRIPFAKVWNPKNSHKGGNGNMARIDDLEAKLKAFLEKESDPEKLKEGAALLQETKAVKDEELKAAEKHAELAKNYREAILTTPVEKPKETEQPPVEKTFDEFAAEAMAEAKKKSATIEPHGKVTL
jgi:hypothetical protein